MRYFSPVVIISQLLLVTSLVQAHHPSTQNGHDQNVQTRSIDDDLFYAREDVLQSLSTRQLVEELSARLDRRHFSLLGTFESIASATPLGMPLSLGLKGAEVAAEAISHGHHKH